MQYLRPCFTFTDRPPRPIRHVGRAARRPYQSLSVRPGLCHSPLRLTRRRTRARLTDASLHQSAILCQSHVTRMARGPRLRGRRRRSHFVVRRHHAATTQPGRRMQRKGYSDETCGSRGRHRGRGGAGWCSEGRRAPHSGKGSGGVGQRQRCRRGYATLPVGHCADAHA